MKTTGKNEVKRMSSSMTVGIFALVMIISSMMISSIHCAPEKKVLTKEETEQRLNDNWKAVKEYAGKELVKTINSEGEFNKYIVRSPRNYTIFILYNTRRNCDICQRVEESYEEVALQYHNLYPSPFYSNVSSPYPSSAAFFFRIYIDQLYDLSIKMGIPTIPCVFHGAMTNKIGFPHKPTQYLHFQGNEVNFNSFEIASFVSSSTSLPVTGFSKPLNMRVIYISSAISVFLLPFLYLLFFHLRSRWTWFYLSMMVYMGMLAGLIGNEVHGTPWFQSNIWTGQVNYFYPSIQRQYRLEGVIASFTIVIGAMSLIYLTQGVNYMKGAVKKRVMFIMVLIVFAAAMSHWLEFFSFKYPAYPYLFFYPIPYRELYTKYSYLFHYYLNTLLSLPLPPLPSP